MTKIDKQLYINLGNELRNLREQKGYSLEEVANRVGLSKKTIQRYETAESRISIDALKKICNVLDADIDKFKSYFFFDFRGDEPEDKMISTKEIIEKNSLLNDEIEFLSAQDAMEFLLAQPQIMAYGGYDLNKMDDETVINFANKILKLIRLEAEGLLQEADIDSDD